MAHDFIIAISVSRIKKLLIKLLFFGSQGTNNRQKSFCKEDTTFPNLSKIAGFMEPSQSRMDFFAQIGQKVQLHTTRRFFRDKNTLGWFPKVSR